MTSKAALMWENGATTKRPRRCYQHRCPGASPNAEKERRLMPHVATSAQCPSITQVGGS